MPIERPLGREMSPAKMAKMALTWIDFGSHDLLARKAKAVPLALNSFRSGPDERGHFGLFGGRFVAETLMPLILDLEKHYAAAKEDPAFKAELGALLTHYVGRPSPLYYAERLTEHLRQKAASAGAAGRRENLFQARGAEPHRRP